MTLLTQKEAADWLRTSISTLYRLRMAGELPYIPGKPVRLRLVDLERYVERKTAVASRKTPRGRRAELSAYQQGRALYAKHEKRSRKA
ncbi:MAG: helix-turn-helix domain-containing protein [Aquisalimonadaceae bacterium]